MPRGWKPIGRVPLRFIAGVRREERLRRLDRAYRRIHLLEVALGHSPEAMERRIEFTSSTARMADVLKMMRGMTRQQRRRAQERMVGRRKGA